MKLDLQALRLVTGFLAVTLGFLAGCSKQAAIDPSVLAKVGSREIRAVDLAHEIEWRQKNRRPVPEAKALLDEMIAQEVLLQRAQAAKLDQDPDVQRAVRNLIVNRFKDRELNPKLEAAVPSAEEIQQLYEQQIEQFTRPGKVRLAIVQLATDATMTAGRLAEQRARAEQARQAALALAPGSQGFGRVSQEFSDDQSSRYKGGDIGWFDRGASGYRWPVAVVAAGFALKDAGAVSEIVETESGFYLVKQSDSRPPVVTPLAQVEETLRRRLATGKRQQVEQAFMREQRAAVPVTAHPAALAAVPFPATTVAKRAESAPPSMP